MSERLGLRRSPVATAVVFGVTAFPNVLRFLVHGMLARLERTPAGLHGARWRSLTSPFAQDGVAAGTLSNLAFLVAAGMLARARGGVPVGRWAALAALLTGTVMTAVEDIHGVALLAGLALAASFALTVRRRASPDAVSR
jgi:hypothetical protein